MLFSARLSNFGGVDQAELAWREGWKEVVSKDSVCRARVAKG